MATAPCAAHMGRRRRPIRRPPTPHSAPHRRPTPANPRKNELLEGGRSLNRALARVIGELDLHGVWNDRMFAVDVHLVPGGSAYGYYHYGGTGRIAIPMLSLIRFVDLYHGEYTSLADVLRHEYGHALADTHRGRAIAC